MKLFSLRNWVLGIAGLLFAFSVVTIGLLGSVLAWADSYNAQRRTFVWTTNSSNPVNYDFRWLPRYTRKRSYYILLAAAVVGMVVSLVAVVVLYLKKTFSVVVTGRKAPRAIHPHFIIITSSCFSICLFAAAIPLLFIDRAENDELVSNRCFLTRGCTSYTGTWPTQTIETYTHMLLRYYSFGFTDIVIAQLDSVTTRFKIARWFSVPCLILSALLLVSGLLLIRQSNIRKFMPRQESNASTLGKNDDMMAPSALAHRKLQSSDDDGKPEIMGSPINEVDSKPGIVSPISDAGQRHSFSPPGYEQADMAASRPIHEAGISSQGDRPELKGSHIPRQMPATQHEMVSELPGDEKRKE